MQNPLKFEKLATYSFYSDVHRSEEMVIKKNGESYLELEVKM